MHIRHLVRTAFALHLLLILQIATANEDIFAPFKNEIQASNPIYEAAKRTGYGSNSLQPYYICDNASSGGALPLNAWHYSCKQACVEQHQKIEVQIRRAHWHYVGKDVPTYKVSTNQVCYTSHENIWGYCSHTQTITPVATVPDDRSKIPKEYLTEESSMRGVTSIINSGHAGCEYLSDNTKCARDYVITYRPGKTSKRSMDDPYYLNIYGDGIRVDPTSGSLFQNEVAWFWNPKGIEETHACGWEYEDPTVCYITNTSEIMSCPDLGYQYNIKNLVSTKTCIGEVYDIDGPAPFIYNSQINIDNRTHLSDEASKGKGDADINMIKGVNFALDRIEEAYCSSSCDLFSRGHPQDDDHVLDTPIGNWRLAGADSYIPLLVPCQPTAVWRVKSPTSMCHGKNHILVEDAKTHHTCSWDATKDYITVGDMCMDNNEQANQDHKTMRKLMSENQNITIDFWTGDTMLMRPPYDKVEWMNKSRIISANPSWFSKVELNKGMLHNTADLSHILTTMAVDMKQEISYNKTADRTIRTLFFDELTSGIGGVVSKVGSWLSSILYSLPKVALMVIGVVAVLLLLKQSFTYYIIKRERDITRRSVHFLEPEEAAEFVHKHVDPSAPSRRHGSRSRRLAKSLIEMGI
ncbi:putative glycoprotein [Zhuye pepper nucleorhabdovirus]|uniref:Glycoprotein n=1 Tax=Zhuye pepper nucleorhabdovirus TaxID=2496274 RepID=A0A4P2UVB8_9RHAB|nr:putative glycoprotein [Green Sichuan pepper nucleorhabdovirus]AZN18348.1 putative glycoprotein [Zhuye pepper nucleorhabdovirus]